MNASASKNLDNAYFNMAEAEKLAEELKVVESYGEIADFLRSGAACIHDNQKDDISPPNFAGSIRHGKEYLQLLAGKRTSLLPFYAPEGFLVDFLQAAPKDVTSLQVSVLRILGK